MAKAVADEGGTDMNMLELSRKRFSTRKFCAEPVSEDDIAYVLEAVRLAPSACNRQPWKFVLAQSEVAREKVCQCYNRDWLRTAPLHVICYRNVQENWRRADGKQHGDIDVAIATEHLCLAAAERGLGTCWICNFDPEKLAALFPREGFEPVAIIPLGHIAPDCPKAEKKRKPLEEIVERI